MHLCTLLLIGAVSLTGGELPKKKRERGRDVYDRYEREEVGYYRQRSEFAVPQPAGAADAGAAQAPDQRPVASVKGYFKGGSILYIDTDPALGQLVSRHIYLNGRTEKTDGYRIQVYSGASRQGATDAKASLMASFPETANYLDFVSPNYVVRAGDFTDREAANAFCQKVRELIPGAFVTPDQVYLQRNLSPSGRDEGGFGDNDKERK
jgi:hypothetical protein